MLRYRDARCVPVPVAAASGAFDGAPVAVGSSTQLMPAAATRAALSRQSSYTPPQSGAMSVQARLGGSVGGAGPGREPREVMTPRRVSSQAGELVGALPRESTEGSRSWPAPWAN